MEESPDYIGSWNMYRKGNEENSLFSMFIEIRDSLEKMIAGRISDYFGTGNFYGHIGVEFINFDFRYTGDAAKMCKPNEPYEFSARPAYGPNVNAFLKRHSENYKPKILSQIINELKSDLEGLMIGEIIQVGKVHIPFYIYPTILNDEALGVYRTFIERIEE